MVDVITLVYQLLIIDYRSVNNVGIDFSHISIYAIRFTQFNPADHILNCFLILILGFSAHLAMPTPSPPSNIQQQFNNDASFSLQGSQGSPSKVPS